MTSSPIYLDHAATTPIDPSVLIAMEPYFTTNFFNPSATYQSARLVKKDIDAARATIAHYVGARPSEIVFTAGGTEANNMIIHGVMSKFPDANCVVSAIEHDSVLNPAAQYSSRLAASLADGRINVENLAAQIDDRTVLVSVQYANNELGTIQPIKEVAAIIQTKKKERIANGNKLPLYLHTDACQTPAYLDIHAARLGVDAMTINASKIYGPKQIGALYVKAGMELNPLIYGGGQERGMRSGTENVASIIGFATALSLVQDRRHEEIRHVKAMQDLFMSELQRINPDIVINGSRKHRLPNNIHITIPGIDNERLMIQLDDQGILCAVGSACNASSEEPSHVLTAIGLNDEEARSSLRFSLGHGTTEADIRRTVDVLAKLLV